MEYQFPIEIYSTKSVIFDELQAQFDSQVPRPKINRLISFQFSERTFVNKDYPLVYSILNPPVWMHFDPILRKITGTPTMAYLDSNVTVTIVASNGYKSTDINSSFTIRLFNNAPRSNEKVDSL